MNYCTPIINHLHNLVIGKENFLNWVIVMSGLLIMELFVGFIIDKLDIDDKKDNHGTDTAKLSSRIWKQMKNCLPSPLSILVGLAVITNLGLSIIGLTSDAGTIILQIHCLTVTV